MSEAEHEHGPEASLREVKAVEAALEREHEEAETPAEVRVHEDETKEVRTPGFSRMRFNWLSEDRHVIQQAIGTADDRVAILFTDAYQIMNDLYEIVRIPVLDPQTGHPHLDRHGWPVWEQTASGRYVEDYSKLGPKDREQFLFQITTRLFDWEQKAADLWSEAMYAKAQWEERFAIAFADTSTGGRKTDEAMTQRARVGAREERYFALFETAVSRKADALVRSLDRLALRLSQSVSG